MYSLQQEISHQYGYGGDICTIVILVYNKISEYLLYYPLYYSIINIHTCLHVTCQKSRLYICCGMLFSACTTRHYNTIFILVVKNTYYVTVRNFQALQVCKQPVFRADFVKYGGGP